MQVVPGRAAGEGDQGDAAAAGGRDQLRARLDRPADHQPDRAALAQPGEDLRQVAVQAHAEHQRMVGQLGLVQRVVDHDAADGLLGRLPADHVQEGRAEFLQDMDKTAHKWPFAATGPVMLGHTGIHSVRTVTASSSSGTGVTPRPGLVGTRRWPSSIRNGSVMSVE